MQGQGRANCSVSGNQVMSFYLFIYFLCDLAAGCRQPLLNFKEAGCSWTYCLVFYFRKKIVYAFFICHSISLQIRSRMKQTILLLSFVALKALLCFSNHSNSLLTLKWFHNEIQSSLSVFFQLHLINPQITLEIFFSLLKVRNEQSCWLLIFYL